MISISVTRLKYKTLQQYVDALRINVLCVAASAAFPQDQLFRDQVSCSQIIKIIIVRVHGSSTPVKLDLTCSLARRHSVQKSFKLIIAKFTSKLTSLGHLAQHGLHLLPFVRLGYHQGVQPGPGLLVQDLTQDTILHVLHLLGSLLLLLLLVTTTTTPLCLHLGHTVSTDLGQLVVAHCGNIFSLVEVNQ